MKNSEQQSALSNWILDNLVHFSNKLTNSNAPGGGIRLSGIQALDLPYVSARTHLHDINRKATGALIELDYVKPTNIRMKDVRVCLGEEVINPPELDLAKDQMSEVAGVYLDAASGRHPCKVADPKAQTLSRLKQILLPLPEDEAYLAVSPLSAAGMAKLLNDTYAARFDQSEQGDNGKGLIPRVRSFPYGGDKPQNVGSRVNEGLSRPFVFDRVPRENDDLKYAHRLFYRGLTLRLPKALIMDYKSFLDSVRREGRDLKVWPASHKRAERAYLQPLWGSWENQARKARRVLEEHAASLPDSNPAWHGETEEARFQAGWLMPSARGHEWKKQAARRFASLLSASRVAAGRDGESGRIALSPTDQHRVASAVLEGFR